jgi:hypothetical protein
VAQVGQISAVRIGQIYVFLSDIQGVMKKY